MADFDEGTIIIQLQKILKNQYQQIGDAMIGGGVDNYDNYKYQVGQARAYSTKLQEISNLLNEKEQNDNEGTIIDLTKRDPKN